MKHSVSAGLAAGACLALVTAGCGAPPSSASPLPPTATPRPTGLPTGSEPVDLDPAHFTADITHPYWPMKPGTRYTYAETEPGGPDLEVVIVVTPKTKRIANGITARVVRDTVTEDGEIVEDTFDWYAQDARGNVWYLGEDTAEFDRGKITTRDGSFEAGVHGALPGILLPADPQPGMRYRQEFYKGQAEDNGEVLSIEELVEVPMGTYTDALLTKDTVALEPTVSQYKLYVRGLGPVLTLDVSGGSGREVLTKVDQAPADAGTGPLGRPNP